MTLSDKFWKHPLTADSYHSSINKNTLLSGESSIIEMVRKEHSTTLVDLGIGTGRELGWIKELPSIKKVIGVDYSSEMLRKCIRVWRDYQKKLMLLDEDFSKSDILSDALAETSEPASFVCLENTFGHLDRPSQKKTVTALSSLMQKGDKVFFHLLKHEPNKLCYEEVDRVYSPVVNAITGKKINHTYHPETHLLDLKHNDPSFLSFYAWNTEDTKQIFPRSRFDIVHMHEIGNSIVSVWTKK